MDVRFATDRNLGKLAKWLRILGYDTLYDRGNADPDFLRKAAADGRIALTRKRNLACLDHPGSSCRRESRPRRGADRSRFWRRWTCNLIR